MSNRYRYRIDKVELQALKEVVLDAVGTTPVVRKDIVSALQDRIPAFVEVDPYWSEKLSTACQRLKREGAISPVRLPGGPGKAWRGWVRIDRDSLGA